MLAHLSFPSTNENHDIYVLSLKEDELITSLPKVKQQLLFPKDKKSILITWYTEEFVYSMDCDFILLRHIQGQPCFKFKIKQAQIEPNIRKEMRKTVELETVFFNFNHMCFGKIVDISPNGFRLLTSEPIKTKQIDLRVNNESDNTQLSPSVENTIVKWSKEENNQFIYGLERV